MPAAIFLGWPGQAHTQEQVGAVTDALREAGTNFVNMEIWDADHGFLCDAKASYSPTAARSLGH
ncbi:MAG: hypothetical protein ACR2NN_03810 [Bryobacteraceae bacterium]